MKKSEIDFDRLLKAVAYAFDASETDILGRSRDRNARRAFVALCLMIKVKSKWSCPKISQLVGRSAQAVVAAVKEGRDLAHDGSFATRMLAARAFLKEYRVHSEGVRNETNDAP